MVKYTESDLEQATLEWLEELGYSVLSGPEISPIPHDKYSGVIPEPLERATYADVVLEQRLRQAIVRLNPAIPEDAKEEAFKKVIQVAHATPSLIYNNRIFHSYLRDGVDVEYMREDGTVAGDKVKLIDFNNPENNDWLAVNQYTVIENGNNRRPDVIIFINGLPIGVIELKNPGDENTQVFLQSLKSNL